MRSTTGAALGTVLALALSACGGGDGGATATASGKDYCNAARGLVKRPAPNRILGKVQAVGNVSPADVARAWHDIVGAIETYADVAQRSLRDPAHPPIGLSPADTRALNRRLLATAYSTNVGALGDELKQVRSQVASQCGFKIAL
jgi:hypothetical protein